MPASSHNVRRVLFVDDDLQFLETIKGLMTAFSNGQWEVSTADSASAAFGVLQSQPMDLIVVDVQMGVIDGVQMLSMLNRRYPDIQKAVLTGLVNEKYRAACLSNGAELFLEKPTAERGWESLFAVLDELAKFKPEEGFRGVLRQVGLQDVLQMECHARSSSVLEISKAQILGQIFLEDGQIIHAQAGDVHGEEAFNQLMALSGGHFNLKPFVEPPMRSISRPWESLLMEVAKKRDTSAVATTLGSTQPDVPILSPVVQPGESARANLRSKVEEFLICSTHGEVLHQWQCHHVDVWMSFFEFLSQRTQRIGQALPLGAFDRLEIQSGDARVVVIISADKGVLVKTQKEPV